MLSVLEENDSLVILKCPVKQRCIIMAECQTKANLQNMYASAMGANSTGTEFEVMHTAPPEAINITYSEGNLLNPVY